jgi:hypothetical protein
MEKIKAAEKEADLAYLRYLHTLRGGSCEMQQLYLAKVKRARKLLSEARKKLA